MGPRVHDRPDGQGSRSGNQLRGAAADAAVHVRTRPAVARRGERSWLRSGRLLSHRQDREPAGRHVTILTVDLGTSSTKAVLWSDERVVALARAPIVTSYPGPGLVEQDPEEWCTSVAQACDTLRREAPGALASVSMVG